VALQDTLHVQADVHVTQQMQLWRSTPTDSFMTQLQLQSPTCCSTVSAYKKRLSVAPARFHCEYPEVHHSFTHLLHHAISLIQYKEAQLLQVRHMLVAVHSSNATKQNNKP
jgi:hypothetical protein